MDSGGATVRSAQCHDDAARMPLVEHPEQPRFRLHWSMSLSPEGSARAATNASSSRAAGGDQAYATGASTPRRVGATEDEVRFRSRTNRRSFAAIDVRKPGSVVDVSTDDADHVALDTHDAPGE